MFSNTGAILSLKDTNGWVFCNGRNTFFAIHFVKSYSWGKDTITGFDLILSDFDKNGWILETVEESRYQSSDTSNSGRFNAFIQDILKNSVVDATKIDDTVPRLYYKSIYGYTMEMDCEPRIPYTNPETNPIVRKINGQNSLSYKDYPTEGSTNDLVYQRRLGDTLFIRNNNQQTLIIWDKMGFTVNNISERMSQNTNIINIYPNPATDRINIDLHNSFQLQKTYISIYNIQGQLLLQKPITQKKSELNICELSKGVYIVKVFCNFNSIVTKFIKE
jgi:hypothetical protein